MPLGPLGLGEVLGGSFRYIRANPASTLGVAFVGLLLVQVVQVVAQLVLSPAAVPTSFPSIGSYLAGTLALSGIVGVVGVVVGAVLSAVLISVLRGALVGRRTSIGEAWRSAAPRVPGLIGLSLLVGLVVVLLMAVGIGLAGLVLGVGRASGAAVAAAVLVAVAAVVLVVYVAVVLSLAVPAYVMEGIGVGAALSRSRALVRGAWWRIFGIVFVAGLLVVAANIVVSLPIGLIGARSALSGLGTTTAVSPGLLVASAVGALVVGTFAAPFISGVTGLLYVDQRIRRERFDLELAARSAAQQPW